MKIFVGVLISWLIGYAIGVVATLGLYREFHSNYDHKQKTQNLAYAPEKLKKSFDVVSQLREGGYIVYFRHAQRQKWDSVIAFDVYETYTKRDSRLEAYRDAVCLTQQGEEEAKMIGRIFELAKVPIGHVAASPICRASQSAMLAFNRIDSTIPAAIHSPVVNFENTEEFSKQLKQALLSIPIKEGKNAIVMAHGNTLNFNTDIFRSGAELLFGEQLQETGFFVIKRNSDGSLDLVHVFLNLGEFAASGITLKPFN